MRHAISCFEALGADVPEYFHGFSSHVAAPTGPDGQGQLFNPARGEYHDRYYVMEGDWYVWSGLDQAKAEQAAEKMRAEGRDVRVVRQTMDGEGWPIEECRRCGHTMVKGGVCPACNYNPRLAKRGRPIGDPNNPYGVSEDFRHTIPDVEWRVVKWNLAPPRDGWFIETNAPGMTGVGGWGPFPTEQAALDYVNKKTVLGQRPLFNPRSTLPGSMADIHGQ